MCVWVSKRSERWDLQVIKSGKYELWANVSLGHAVFASPFARVHFSVTPDISHFRLIFIREWDKNHKDLWAYDNLEHSIKAPSFPPCRFIFFSCTFVFISPLYVLFLFPWHLRESLDRQRSSKNGWWTERRKTLVAHYSRGEFHYRVICVALFFFLWVPDFSYHNAQST